MKNLFDMEEVVQKKKGEPVERVHIGSPIRLLQDTNDLNLLDKQFSTFSRSANFRRVWETKTVAKAGDKRQAFYREAKPVYDALMMELGFGKDNSPKGSKQYFVSEISSLLPELDEIETYRIINSSTGKIAVRTEESDYEISVVVHREPQYDFTGEVEIIGKIKPHALEIADKITEKGYNIIRLKNNLVTIENDDRTQMSVKITKKKKRLF